MSEDVPTYGQGSEAPMNRAGCKLLRELKPDERWAVHPSGDGIVVCHPDRPMVWVRVVDGDVLEETIDLAGIPSLSSSSS